MSTSSKRELVAKLCGMELPAFNRLVSMKKLAGKTISQIERDLEQIAWARKQPLVFVNDKGSN
jgi:hypothetical protein